MTLNFIDNQYGRYPNDNWASCFAYTHGRTTRLSWPVWLG